MDKEYIIANHLLDKWLDEGNDHLVFQGSLRLLVLFRFRTKVKYNGTEYLAFGINTPQPFYLN